jgi:predicted NBD/HSP70 family sugar kinase
VNITATTPQVLRRTNLKAVLDVMRGGGTCTGTDLMERTGLTRATVIAVCDDLVRRGWVRELAAERNGGIQKGRPARRFEFNEGAGCVLGLDVGVATVTAQVADLKGTILGAAARRIPGRAAEATNAVRLDTITSTVDAALEDAGKQPSAVLSVGVGVATAVDRHGNIATGHELSSTFELGLQTEVWRERAWPVLLENDANLAALAERWRGIASGTEDLAVLLAGERLGAGLIESGRLLHGRNGGAGEVGILQLVEGVGSKDGIARLARHWGTQALAEGRPTLIRELVGPGTSRVSARFVFEAAARQDAVALEILDRIARRIARVIAVLGTFLDPELVVIAGAVAGSAAALLPTIRDEIKALTGTPPRVEVSGLGDGIVATGAVRLALDYVEENMPSLTPGGIAEPVR